MMPPYVAGSSKSPIFEIIENHIPPVKITQEELDKIAAWIDLLVPHDGEYTESMSDDDQALYQTKMDKRRAWEAVEEANIASYISIMHPAGIDRSPANRRGNSKGPKLIGSKISDQRIEDVVKVLNEKKKLTESEQQIKKMLND
jgi:hypothetical protein